MRRWPYVVPVIAVVLLVGVFGKRLVDVEHGDDPHLLPTVLLDTPMPAFDLQPLPDRSDNGAAFTNADLNDRVSLVNVWGSWCVACLQEHPVLMEIARQGLVPLHGVDWRDKPERGMDWLRKHGDPYDRVGQDPHSEFAIDLGVTGAPETFVIDANGVIHYKYTGPLSEDVWRQTLLPLITELRK